MFMYCKKCGAENISGKFCENCGEVIESISTQFNVNNETIILSNKIKRYSKYLKNDSIILAIMLIISLMINYIDGLVDSRYIIVLLIHFSMLLLVFVGSNQKKKYAGIMGIIYGLLLFTNFEIITIMLGVFMITHSVKYIMSLRN